MGTSYMPNALDDTTLELLPYEIGPYADTFTGQSGGWGFDWGLEGKYRFVFNKTSFQNYLFESAALGLQVLQTTNLDQTGKVLQFGMPVFENYQYTLNIKSTRIMADLDMVFHPIGHHVFPFVEAGIGLASTSLTYTSKPIAPITGPNFTIPEESSLSFAYQFGLGLKYMINPHVNLSLRYLYTDMGTADTAKNANTATLAKPIIANMNAQSILFGFTYVP